MIEMARIIRAALKEEALERAVGQTNSLMRMMDAYTRSPDSLESALVPIWMHAENTYAEPERLKSLAAGAVSIQAPLFFSTTLQIYILNKRGGD